MVFDSFSDFSFVQYFFKPSRKVPEIQITPCIIVICICNIFFSSSKNLSIFLIFCFLLVSIYELLGMRNPTNYEFYYSCHSTCLASLRYGASQNPREFYGSQFSMIYLCIQKFINWADFDHLHYFQLIPIHTLLHRPVLILCQSAAFVYNAINRLISVCI